MTTVEIICWQLSGRLTEALLTAGAPAVLVLLVLVRSLQTADAPGCIRQVERQAVLGVLLVSLAWVPWYPASINDKQVAMPPAWYLLYSLSELANEGIVAGLPQEQDLAAKVVALTGADLREQPELHREYEDFERECYLPARRKVVEMGLDEQVAAWPGAKDLVQTPGLYRRCGSETGGGCEQGFLAPQRGVADAQSAPAMSCRQWWLGNGDRGGLRDRLVAGLQKDAQSIWKGALSEDEADAWLQSYLLRAGRSVGGFVGKATGVIDDLRNLWDKASNLFNGVKQAASAAGTLALAWQIGPSGMLLLYLMPGALERVQVFLLALISLLWPVIALLSGLSVRTFVATGRVWLLINLWTGLAAVGTMLHQLLWQQVAGHDNSMLALATQLLEPSQLILWYLASSMPWITPLAGSWMLWKLSALPARSADAY